MLQNLHYAQEAQRVEHRLGVQVVLFFFFSLFFLAADISGLSLIKGRSGTPIHSSFRQVSPLLTSPLRNFSVLSAAG